MARAYAMVEAARAAWTPSPMTMRSRSATGDGEVVLAWQEGEPMAAHHGGLAARNKRSSTTTSRRAVVRAARGRGSPVVMGWDIQAAMHERALDVLDPDNAGRRKHFYINQENEPPYALTVVRDQRGGPDHGPQEAAMAPTSGPPA
jgi:hypothetical protein